MNSNYYYDNSDSSSDDENNFSITDISADMSKLTIIKQDPFTLNGQTTDIVLSFVENGPRNHDLYNATSDAQVSKDNQNDFTPKFGTKAFGSVNAFGCGALAFEMMERDLKVLASMTQSDRFKLALNNWRNKSPLAFVLTKASKDPFIHYKRNKNGGQVTLSSFFSKDHKRVVDTSLSFDIVVHEVAHYFLDVLRPKFADVDRPQTKALHESWSDLLVIFTILDQSILRHDLLNQTKGDLSKKSFLPTIAEEFGKTVNHNRKGLRNAAELITMKNVEKEVHSFSQVFTGAIYDLLAIAFRHKLIYNQTKKMDEVLEKVAKDIKYLTLLAFIEIDFDNPSFSDLRILMEEISTESNRFRYLSEYIPQVFDARGIFRKKHSRMDKYDNEIQSTHPVTHGAEFSLCKTCHKGSKY